MGQQDLPLASWQRHAQAFEQCGWTRREMRRRRAENHVIMTKTGVRAAISIPKHDPVKRGTLQKLLRVAGLSEEEYLRCFNAR